MGHPPRSVVNVGIAWTRSMCSATPSGRVSRFVRDENGKLVRSNVGGSGGGRGRGESRVGGGSGRSGRGGGGGGRGGGRRTSGGGRALDPRRITSIIQSATHPQDILIFAKDNLSELNHIHVNAVFNRLGKMANSRDFSPQRLTTDLCFQELLGLTRNILKSGKYEARIISNITHGIAKLHGAGRLGGLDGDVDEVLTALEGAAGRVAPDMNPQEVSNTVWGYATLGRMPGEDTWAALEGAAGRVAPDMKPQNVANTVWG